MTHTVSNAVRAMCAVTFALSIVSATASDTRAADAEARNLLKAMSDYMAGQKSLSFDFDVDYEVVTKEGQKLLLASSGTVNVSRPDKLRATRSGGFANVETLFDGKTLTMFGKGANVYAQVDVPGSLDNLMDVLRDKLQRPVPGADLLLSNVYGQLMTDVIDVKDLGSGIIGGVECDHLAFRTKDVDWQIWIAHGAQPYPCRYVITSKQVKQAPQYSIQIKNWKTGTDVAADDFRFANSSNAKKIDAKQLTEFNELPKQFVIGGQ
jgi:hypothetical protein